MHKIFFYPRTQRSVLAVCIILIQRVHNEHVSLIVSVLYNRSYNSSAANSMHLFVRSYIHMHVFNVPVCPCRIVYLKTRVWENAVAVAIIARDAWWKCPHAGEVYPTSIGVSGREVPFDCGTPLATRKLRGTHIWHASIRNASQASKSDFLPNLSF